MSFPLRVSDSRMRFKFGSDRRNDWRCCFCCHVRTGTIFLGLWHLMLHILALLVIAVILRNPEVVIDYGDDSYAGEENSVSSQNKLNLAPALPTPLSSELGPNAPAEVQTMELEGTSDREKTLLLFRTLEAMTEQPAQTSSQEELMRKEGEESEKKKRPPPKKYNSFTSGSTFRDILDDLNAGIVVTFCTFIITLLMIYGAMRNKPSYLMPFFCLQVFDFCIACLTAVGYLCYLPDIRRLVVESKHLPIAAQLNDMHPQSLSYLLMLMFLLAMALKAYFIGVVWRCYKYLALRRVAQLRTVHFIDSPPETLGTAVAPDSPLSHQEALLLLPDYETAISDPRYTAVVPSKGSEKAKGGPSVGFDSLVLMAPPPAYSTVVQDANQVVPEEETNATSQTSQEREVPESPVQSPPAEGTTAEATASSSNSNTTPTST
ncbi:lysosomal-associated transmembrane protein 4A isoform X2 [Hetaerina americana]|uniref:lysosomal-associated transmembrane protein 4A isoform X2 n=1 Tax=Hetaerina americana TaxID=62018 RepID=UPI003A7F28C9